MRIPVLLVLCLFLGGAFSGRSQCSALLCSFSVNQWGQRVRHSIIMHRTRMWHQDERRRLIDRDSYRIGDKRYASFLPARQLQQARTMDEIESYLDHIFLMTERGSFQGLSPKEEVELIRVLGQRKAFECILRSLQFCRGKMALYEAAVSALSQSRSRTVRSRTLRLLDDMDSQGIPPTSRTLTALLSCVDGPVGTTKLLERIQQYDSVKFVHVYNAAIVACSRVSPAERSHVNRNSPEAWQKALSIFFEMRKEGIAPNIRTYGSILHVCAQSGQVRIALSLLDEMRNRGVEPNEQVWGAVLNACAKVGDYERAVNLIAQMQSDGGKPNTRHLSSLLAALAKAAQDELALEILEGMQQNREINLNLNGTAFSLRPSVPDLVAVNTVLAAFAKANNYERAKQLLKRLKSGQFASINNHENVIRPDEISYNTVLSACRDSHEAKSLVKEMRLSRRHRYGSIPPSSISYVHAITACRKSHVPDLESALFLLESARHDGIDPNVFMCSAVIWTAEAVGNAETALSILNEMKANGPSPNSICYDGVISCLARNRQMAKAIDLFEEMKNSEIAPSATTYKRLASVINTSNTTGNKKIDALERVVRRMDAGDRRAEVGGPVIEALIRAYASEPDGYHAAKRLFNTIKGPANGSCLCAIMYACTKARPSQWKDAVSILHSSDIVTGAAGPGRIDSRALSYAVLACATEGEWEEAMNLVNLYGIQLKRQRSSVSQRQTSPTISVAAFNALISACGRGGRPEVSLRVLNEMEYVYGVSPDSRSYRAAAIVCNQAEHDKRRRRNCFAGSSHHSDEVERSRSDISDSSLQWWECALSLLRRMKEANNIEPDAPTYSSVISACEAAGQWQRALGVLRSMNNTKDTSVSVQPNLYCFNSAISACEKGGAWLEALELYERMKERGGTIRPNCVTLNSLLVALDKAGQKELAQTIYDEGAKEGIVSPWKKTLDQNGVQIRAVDLHSFSTAMANAAIRSILYSLLTEHPVHDLSEKLVIIVGKGKGSEDKPVLLPAVQCLLTEEFGIESTADVLNAGRLVIEPTSLQTFVEKNRW